MGCSPIFFNMMFDRTKDNYSGHISLINFLVDLQKRSAIAPSATVGPDEPHVASTAWPEDGLLEKQGLGKWEHEIKGTDLEGFLSSRIPSHPKLYRGQLKNGLRYVILPNKVPPNR
jgi:hypothetical protein